MHRAVFAVVLLAPFATAQTVHTGQGAFRNWDQQKPGERVHLTLKDLPEPNEAEAVDNGPSMVARGSAMPIAPAGFKVELYAEGGFTQPRLIRSAPNGDVFLADSGGRMSPGKVIVLRGVKADGTAAERSEFATGLDHPFGINFYPEKNPQWIYVANTTSIVRFPYKAGDMKASGPAQTVVEKLPGYAQLRGGGHWTRDIAFSLDGKRMFISVGSGSNVDDKTFLPNGEEDPNGKEFHRADILEYTPEGKFVKIYASGIRNCVGEAVHPQTGELWCSVNERDRLGNHLVPDYITHVQEGGFYGWPWWYMGGHQDPRHAGKHAELKNKVITPDILVQPHMASLQMVFYPHIATLGTSHKAGSVPVAFPSEYQGGIFAAEHGSWNRKDRAGYEVIFAPMNGGKAKGEYSDFLTGFTTNDAKVWGRPVGVTVAKDGSLLVVDDGSKIVWRVVYTGKK